MISALNHLKIYNELKRNVWLKTPELERIQQKKLRAIINHAYHSVPFYHELFDSAGIKPGDIKTVDDLSKVPMMTKQQVQRAGSEIIAKNVDIKKCVEGSTSGSTGIPLTMFYTKEDRAYKGYDRARTENGFRLFGDLLLGVTGHPTSKGKRWYQYFGMRKRAYISVFDDIEIQISTLRKTKPDAIWGYPSNIKLLGRAIEERGIEIEDIGPRLIFTASEVLDIDTRNFINSAFNVDVIDVYGAWESGCMAWECSEHAGYHIEIDTGVMEFVDEKGEGVSAGEKGEVIVTNLHSYAMPFIRYKIGDIAVPMEEKCPCGRGLPLMKAIEGRSDDFVKLADGRILSPLIFFHLMKPFYGMIASFKVIQEKEDHFTVMLVRDKNFSEDVIVQIKREFKKVLGSDIQIEPRIIEEITKDKLGKLRSVISRV